MDNKLVIKLLTNKTEEIQNLLVHFSNNPDDMAEGMELLESRMKGLINEFEILKRNFSKQNSGIDKPVATTTEPKQVKVENPDNQSPAIDSSAITETVEMNSSLANENKSEVSESLALKKQDDEKNVAIVYESLHTETVEIVGEKFPGRKITDIQSAIGINDRFLFTRELFGNNADDYNSAVSFINKSENFQSVLDWIKKEKHWDLEDSTVAHFLEITKRKF